MSLRWGRVEVEVEVEVDAGKMFFSDGIDYVTAWLAGIYR